MALTLSESAKQERKLPEAGATVGMLYSLVDLGTQETNWDGEKKYTPKVRLTFELPDQTDEFEVESRTAKRTKVSKPMVVIHRADPLALARRPAYASCLSSGAGRPLPQQS
jgi:hypothetical protein